jgi:GT2 family glycosyltransferase
MKVAAVSLTYNDDYKFDEWYNHYENYKDDIFIHIIVDNNSNIEYFEKLKNSFKDSHIIRRESNGGCTGAYNDGIRYALSIAEVDAVMLIGNDISLKKDTISILYKTLFSNSKIGMVAPILLNKQTNIVEDFGCEISASLMMIPYCEGSNYTDLKEDINYCESVTGGSNLARRDFYETVVGLQDENLFMYSDEVDMGIRSKQNGYIMASLKNAVCYHEHINNNIKTGRRGLYTKYLAGRNKVYIAKKHFGILKISYVFSFYFFGSIFRIFQNLFKGDFNRIQEYLWLIFGAVMGLIGNMKANKFSVPKKNSN